MAYLTNGTLNYDLTKDAACCEQQQAYIEDRNKDTYKVRSLAYLWHKKNKQKQFAIYKKIIYNVERGE